MQHFERNTNTKDQKGNPYSTLCVHLVPNQAMQTLRIALHKCGHEKEKYQNYIHAKQKAIKKELFLSFFCIHGLSLLMRFQGFFPPPCPSCSVIAVTSRHMDCWQRMLHLCFAPDLKSLQCRGVGCLHSDSRQPVLALHLPRSPSL